MHRTFMWCRTGIPESFTDVNELLLSKASLNAFIPSSPMRLSAHEHVLDLVRFSPYLGVLRGGAPKGLGHNLFMQFSASAAQKWKVPKLIFFSCLGHPKSSNIRCKACFTPSLCVFQVICCETFSLYHCFH